MSRRTVLGYFLLACSLSLFVINLTKVFYPIAQCAKILWWRQ